MSNGIATPLVPIKMAPTVWYFRGLFDEGKIGPYSSERQCRDAIEAYRTPQYAIGVDVRMLKAAAARLLSLDPENTEGSGRLQELLSYHAENCLPPRLGDQS